MITKKILSFASSGACGSNFALFGCVLRYFGYRKTYTDYISVDSGGIPHCFPQFGPGPMQQVGSSITVPFTSNSLHSSTCFQPLGVNCVAHELSTASF